MNKRKVQLKRASRAEYLSGIQQTDEKMPNIVLVMVDDMGHGDISCYGSQAISTPNIDSIAAQGVKLDNFYAASPVCSPSRFSCLTGRYPLRNFIHGVFFPTVNARGRFLNRMYMPYGVKGILPDEITTADALRARGYSTGIFGKWHLGDKSPYLPNEHGFDHFFGSYYSNDMRPYAYYRNNEIAIPAEADQTTLTKALTTEIKSFIEENKDKPFFVYYASPFPHNPVHSSLEFSGTSNGGAYGDCVQEIDWSVGEIRSKLNEYGIADNTLIIFTSDNGPWYEGNPGYHRGRKGLTFDGGQIVPFVASWPNVLPKGATITQAAMNIDLFPTFLNMAGIPLPTDRAIDGCNLLPLLCGNEECTHDELYFISKKRVMAVRSKDNFKYLDRHYSDNQEYWILKQGPFLFDLNHDFNESYNASTHFPEKAEELRAKLDEKREEFKRNPRGW